MISNYVKFPRERGIVVFEVELIFTLRNMDSDTSCLISKASSILVVSFAVVFRDVTQRSPERNTLILLDLMNLTV